MIPEDNISHWKPSNHLLIIMGVSGSGKSTLAHALAQKYGYQYLDGDDFHTKESRDLMAQGIPLNDEQRAPWVATIKQSLEANARQQIHTVLAFSGLKQKHRAALHLPGWPTLVLYLKGSIACIRDRVAQRQGHFVAPSLLDSQFASMEEPVDETDVHVLEVGPKHELMMQQAQALMQKYLPGV